MPNQYQRRVAKKRTDVAIALSSLITTSIFTLCYILLRPALDASMNQEVLESAGRLSLESVQIARVMQYFYPVFGAWVVVWLLITFVLKMYLERRYNRFEFVTDDQADDLHAQITDSTVQLLPSINLHKISPAEFERVIADLITHTTGYKAEVCGGRGDKGIDILVYDSKHQLVGVVQCKRYNPDKALSPSHVREVATVKQRNKVNIAYLATTAYFTESTKKEARDLGVKLIDGYDLKRIMRHGQDSHKRKIS